MKVKIFIALFAILALQSCEKVLDVAPQGAVAEGTLNADFVDKLVTAAYSGLAAHFFGNDESFAGPSTNWIMDVRADDSYKGGGSIADRSDIHQLETATFDPTNYAVFQKWRNNMFGIERCNLAIREILALEDATYPKVVRIAEMQLLRGVFHMDLKRNFNQIPYLTENSEPTTTSNIEFSSEELWTKIEADFQAAFDALPTSQTETGRVNKYVAAAFLCKVQIETQQWQKAIASADFVIAGPYALLPEFEDLATLEFESGSESVFTVQYSTANIFANHNWSNLLNSTAGPGIDAGAYASGDDFYHGSQNLINTFRTSPDGLPLFNTFNDTDVETGSYSGTLDPRVDFTFGRIGIPWKGTAVYDASWIRSTDYYPGFSSKKHVVAPDDPNVHNSWPWAASGLNFNLIRYAEVLLWKAEALIESGDPGLARDLINQVRDRAKNSTYVKQLGTNFDAANYLINPYPADNWDVVYARQALRFERRLELAMEGHRMYDLVRWGIAPQVMNEYFTTEALKKEYYSGSNFVTNKHEYLPIPQGEIDLAPDLYRQNDGY